MKVNEIVEGQEGKWTEAKATSFAEIMKQELEKSLDNI